MKLLAFVVVRIFPCLGLRELSKNHRCVIPGAELEGEFGGEKFSFLLFYSNHEFSTTNCTLLLYSLTESRNSIAASLFAGEFGFGSHNKLCIDVNTAATS